MKRFRLHSGLFLPLIWLAVFLQAQSRFGRDDFGGELRGFTKGSQEHIIDRWPETLVVARLEGEVRARTTNEPLGGVLFEVRGPADSDQVRGRRTKTNGQFRFGRLKPGQYTFKATRDGFQSLVGHIRVDPRAQKSAKPIIKLDLGV
jgi:hypothetical protein